MLTPAGPWTPSCISEPIYKVSGAQGLCSYERRSPASFESGRAAGDPQLQGCICGGKRGHLCVLVFLGLCAVSRAACMTVWLLHERRVYLSGYNSDLIPFSSRRCFFTMWLLQTAKQTNKQTLTHGNPNSLLPPHCRCSLVWPVFLPLPQQR